MKRSAFVVALLVLCCTAPAAASTPTRYIDEVFGRVSVTRDVVYGRSRTATGVDRFTRVESPSCRSPFSPQQYARPSASSAQTWALVAEIVVKR